MSTSSGSSTVSSSSSSQSSRSSSATTTPKSTFSSSNSSTPSSTSPLSPTSTSSSSSSSSSSTLPLSSSNPDSSSSTSSKSTSATSSILTAPSTSIYQTASVETSNGVESTVIVTQTSVFSAGTVVTGVSSASSQSNTNIGPIVGGVVGGVGGLALIALVIFFFLRWRRRKSLDDIFDGDFDPGHVTATGVRKNNSLGGTLPRINVPPEEDDGMGGRLAASDLGIHGTVTPFYNARPLQQQEMSEKARILAAQNNNYGYPQAGPSHHTPPPTFPVPQATSTGSSSIENGYNAPYAPTVASSSTGGYYSRVPMQPLQQQQHLYSPPGSEVGSSRGGKDRDSSAVVSNPEENSDVIVHQDGGRVDEIPPSYDSIPADERR